MQILDMLNTIYSVEGVINHIKTLPNIVIINNCYISFNDHSPLTEKKHCHYWQCNQYITGYHFTNPIASCHINYCILLSKVCQIPVVYFFCFSPHYLQLFIIFSQLIVSLLPFTSAIITAFVSCSYL